MPKRTTKQAAAVALNDLNQLPPWLEEMEPDLIKLHFTKQNGGALESPSRIRRLAQVYIRWGHQFLRCADLMEDHMAREQFDLEKGDWRGVDRFTN